MNLTYAAVYIWQNDQSLNSFSSLCGLLEKAGVKLLPAEVSGISYRNDNAALTFLQHMSNVLHTDLVRKIKRSSVLGWRWMMDESTSRSIEKNCIVYVSYLENVVPKTAFYGLINMEGGGPAENIVKRISELWRNDDIITATACWLATDNASTFKGIHEGLVEKLKKNHNMACIELNTCAAHPYALVGKRAGQYLDITGNAFQSWNDPESRRRLNSVQLLLDVPDDYDPQRQVRPNAMKRKRINFPTTYISNSTKPKANDIKCANQCGKQFRPMIQRKSMPFYAAISTMNMNG
ncbi:unnamed protein product [Rotaria socialis]|uniref:Uncharacterized protein n=2 Tax=Rotaria socialis TaxID=392032 RepID=A0A821TI62_9BILA|nr:unnamed protein product [Rotaria socialis]CAF4874773.1 unnamed protein product [Rotaria socialis]